LSLVDPDNRRPVDYALRERLLRELTALAPERAPAEIMQRAEEGLPKLWTIHRALMLRRERPRSFGAEAAYRPLIVTGAKACHAIAYLRGRDVATIVPRLVKSLGKNWEQTAVELPRGEWTNLFTGAHVQGGRLDIEDALREFPVALLAREQQEMRSGDA
jgi:(1->4)-alpha-D-glucan 1-alpha-D-glucosylmutase